MERVDEQTINYRLFEDGTAFLGVARLTMPTISHPTATIKGSGISGSYESPTRGHVDPMEVGIEFIQMTEAARNLLTPKHHLVEARYVQQYYDPTSAEYMRRECKEVFKLDHKSTSGGTIEAGTLQSPSGTYALKSWVGYVDGEETVYIDPSAYKYAIDGVDYLEEDRTFLGL